MKPTLDGLPPNRPSTDGGSRRARFVAAYEQTRNVSAAMRAVGVSSRSTAYRWLRWYREDGPELPTPRTRARRTNRTSQAIKDDVVDLRQSCPSWGRRRIANELTRRHGRPVVSPASVTRILAAHQLWRENRHGTLTGWTEINQLNPDQLLADCQRGVQLAVFHHAREASDVLGAVWEQIGADHDRRAMLLREPILGSWLLRSLIQLGHALIVAGRWFQAWGCLDEARRWLATFPSDRRQAAFADGAQWESGVLDAPWTPFTPGIPLSGSRPSVSLRRDDIWFECCQYLGVVLRDDPSWRGVEALRQGPDPRRRANAWGTL